MTSASDFDRADAFPLAVLEGAWEFEDWTTDYADGRPRFRPMGDGAHGLLIYAPEGHMSACVRRRTPVSETFARGAGDGTPSAFGNYFSYAGRYRIERDAIVHMVDVATLPAMIGREQKRQVSFTAGRMVLTAHDPARGRTDTIEWRRARCPDR